MLATINDATPLQLRDLVLRSGHQLNSWLAAHATYDNGTVETRTIEDVTVAPSGRH